MKIERPLDMLNQNKGKDVLVNLKNGKQYSGQLMAFDLNINLVVDNVSELEDNEIKKKLGLVFFRGDGIVYVSPA